MLLKYDIFKLLNMEKRPCNAELSWNEDKCIIDKVQNTRAHTSDYSYISLKLSEDIVSEFNCTVPWLLEASRFG